MNVRGSRRLFAAVALMFSGAAVFAAPASTTTAGACDAPIALAGKDAALREAFNDGKGKVRLVFLMDPVCPGCLRGLSDLNRDVLSKHAMDERVSTLIVHMPVLGATESDVANSCELLRSTQPIHFWDATGGSGHTFSRALGMKDENGAEIFAWDTWIIYGPDAEWVGEVPPKPVFAMHQLKRMMKQATYPFLDSAIFATVVEQQLGTVHAMEGPRHE